MEKITMFRKKDDILLKSAFEEAFPDLLRFYFQDADSIFDMERGFEFMDKELSELFPELEKPGGTRFVDMLVKTFLKDGTEEWILVHLEIQGGNTKKFAHRMFRYWYRIYDRYEVDITALAVFTGGKNQKKPDIFYKSFLGTEVSYKYNTYHILDHSEEELLNMDNPFSLIVLAAQKALLRGRIPEEELGEQRLTVARALIQSQKYSHEQIMHFLYFLKHFIYIENLEINRNFDREIELLTGKENAMGMQIGWSQASGAWTFFTLCSYDQSPLEISIATEEDSLSEFITGFQLHRIEDIDHLDYNSAWMRYLNGGAEIIVTPMELEASLSFRIVKSKTIIFSLDMHFYDEVPEHLTMPEDFDRYILENDKLLWAASNNRYKFSKR